MAVVNELVTKFVFKGNLKPLKSLKEDLRTSVVSLTKYTAVVTAAATATFLWVNSTLRGTEALVRLSQETDISIRKLQQYQFIAAKNGLTNEAFIQSIQGISDKIGEAATQGNEDFNRLGVSVRDANGNIKNTETVINEIIASFSTLDAKQKINFAGKLGVDKRFISALTVSDKELNKLLGTFNKFGTLTEKQTKELDKYFASIETLKFGFKSVSQQVALTFAPSIVKLSDTLVDFLATFGKTFTLVFGEFFDGIGTLLSSVNTIIDATVGWKTVLIGLGVAFAVAFPIVPIVVGVGLILTAVEDLIVAFSGGKSVIADFFSGFGIDIVESLTTAFSFLELALKSIVIFFRPVLKAINNILKPLELLPGVGKIFSGANIALDKLDAGGGTALPATPNNNIATTTQTQTNQINIEVSSNDPQAAAQAVGTSLQTQIDQASFQFGKGGK